MQLKIVCRLPVGPISSLSVKGAPMTRDDVNSVISHMNLGDQMLRCNVGGGNTIFPMNHMTPSINSNSIYPLSSNSNLLNNNSQSLVVVGNLARKENIIKVINAYNRGPWILQGVDYSDEITNATGMARVDKVGKARRDACEWLLVETNGPVPTRYRYLL